MVRRAALLASLSLLVLLATAPAALAGLFLEPAYTDSAIAPVSNPIYATAPPGDTSRLFVVERAGRIRLAVGGVMRDQPFLNITARVNGAGEGGLLSMAFAPDYATSGKFYVYFVEHPDAGVSGGDILIEEYTRSAGDANVANPTPRPIVEIQHDAATNHYGGTIAFGPDGVLYAAPGDGGTGGAEAQNSGSLLGKLLAIDTDATPGATVVASGLRNPFRWSFDRATGDITIGDVGQSEWEEIDWLRAGTFSGVSFGWPCFEGFEQRTTGCVGKTLTAPVHVYGRSAGRTVTGGVVVRDPALTPLVGRYLYADHYQGDIRSLALGTPASDDRSEGLPTVTRIVAFGEDAAARVHVVSLFNDGTNSFGGKVWRLACDATCPAPSAGGPTPTDPGPGTPAPTGPGTTTTPPTSTPDTRAPRLSIRYRRVQDVLRLRRVRLSAACDENCAVRVGATARGIALRGVLRRLRARDRVVLTLLASKRVRRRLAKRGVVSLTVRARDAAGNVTSRRLTVRVKR